MIEVTRVELPAKEGHRGRKPCEWRIGDFVVPKSLNCSTCNEDKATTKDSFVNLLEKSGLEPEDFVNGYICRSCRASAKRASKPVEVVTEVESNPRFETKKRRISHCGKELGLVVNGKKLIFYGLNSEFQAVGLTLEAFAHADEIYDLTLGVCIKHREDLTQADLHGNMSKFSSVKRVYSFEDMNEVVIEATCGSLA